MNVQDQVLVRAIIADAAYAGHLASDLGKPEHAAFAGTVSLCMVPYLLLFVHESCRQIKVIDPTLPSLLSSDAESIAKRSRHSLKLFEDKRGIEGQLAYFRDEILPAHSDRFLNNTWLRMARFLETDLGLFSYNHKIITTTHAATFHMGVDPIVLLKEGAGEQLRAIWEEYGRYFARLGATLDPTVKKFVSYLDPAKFDKWPNDVRANRYYCRVFNGKDTLELNVLLTVFRGMLNFVESVITAGAGHGLLDYTVFKVRYLTLYQALRSLMALHDERSRQLGKRSMRLVEEIIGRPDVKLITDPAAKPFRRTLIHYGLDAQIDTTRMDVTKPLFGLIPICFPSYDIVAFGELIDHCMKETAAALNEWANG